VKQAGKRDLLPGLLPPPAGQAAEDMTSSGAAVVVVQLLGQLICGLLQPVLEQALGGHGQGHPPLVQLLDQRLPTPLLSLHYNKFVIMIRFLINYLKPITGNL
jgi:hypothetical protein